MIVFILMLAVTLLAAGVSKFVLGKRADWRACMRAGLAAALLFAGIDHLVTPGRYLSMMPDYLPLHFELVIFTGVCEIAGAIGLLWRRTRKLAGVMLAIYFVAVFPANLHNALHGTPIEGMPQDAWYYWLRLAFQPVLLAWALYCSGAWRLRRRKRR